MENNNPVNQKVQMEQQAPNMCDPQAAHDYLLTTFPKQVRVLSDMGCKFFSERGIDPEVARQKGVFSLKQRNGSESIAFVYHENGLDHSIKTRGVEVKRFAAMPTGAKQIPYNADVIGKFRYWVITEGENDALAFMAAGIAPASSAPNGGGPRELKWLEPYKKQLEKVELIYIATDNDLKGNELAVSLIAELGSKRCRRVSFGDCKDANQLLMEQGPEALVQALDNAVEIPIPNVLTLNYDTFEKHLIEGGMRGVRTGFDPLDNVVRWRLGTFAIVTGIPGHGKSEFVDFLTMRLNRTHGWKVGVYSPENQPVEYHMGKLASKISGRKFNLDSLDTNDLVEIYRDIKSNYFFINPLINSVDEILKACEELVVREGVQVITIDPFNTLEYPRIPGMVETEFINEVLGAFAAFVRKYPVLLILVAHPRKMEVLNPGKGQKRYKEPVMYDISGSAHFYNRADVGMVVYRSAAEEEDESGCKNFVRVTVEKIRWRELGVGGECMLRYNYNNGRYESITSVTNNWDNDWWQEADLEEVK